MRAWIRSKFNVADDDPVAKARAARDQQLAQLAKLQADKAALEATIQENEVLGAKYKAAVQARLDARAAAAEPALDVYDAMSTGKILYDQTAQLVAKVYEGIYNAGAMEQHGYGFRSKQFFSAQIAADSLSRHLRRWAAEPFDHLVLPLMTELNDCGMDPTPVAPLLEFAHEGCVPRKQLDESVLRLREQLAKHRAAVGGSYATGKPVNWESLLDALKFSGVKHLADSEHERARRKVGGMTVTEEMSLMEAADAAAEQIEECVRAERWAGCVANVESLWSILAPTLRGAAGATDATVPLIKSMFDIRAAAEQHVAADFFEDYSAAQISRHQAAFTMKLFASREEKQQQ